MWGLWQVVASQKPGPRGASTVPTNSYGPSGEAATAWAISLQLIHPLIRRSAGQREKNTWVLPSGPSIGALHQTNQPSISRIRPTGRSRRQKSEIWSAENAVGASAAPRVSEATSGSAARLERKLRRVIMRWILGRGCRWKKLNRRLPRAQACVESGGNP